MEITKSNHYLRDLASLTQQDRERVESAVNILPLGDIQKVQGKKNAFRLRVGELRVIFDRYGKYIVLNSISKRENTYGRRLK